MILWQTSAYYFFSETYGMKNTTTLYLASSSPRRWQLLQGLGFDLIKLDSEIDETPYPNESVLDYVTRMAIQKNQRAQQQLHQSEDHPIVSADTTVTIDNQILGKPTSVDDAFVMLKQLSGRTHQVMTAVTVSYRGEQKTVVQVSDVTFAALSDAMIHTYIATGEPMDKAGSYGIHGFAGVFVEKINGSFTGVMGLPLFETTQLLQQLGLPAYVVE